MAVYSIRCTDPHHPQNSAEPGWNDGVLGTVALPDGAPPAQVAQALADHVCPGCALANANTAAAAEAARAAASVAALGFDDGGELPPEVYAGFATLQATLRAAPSDPFYGATLVVDPAYRARLDHVTYTDADQESALVDVAAALGAMTGVAWATTPTPPGATAVFVAARATLAGAGPYDPPDAVRAALPALAGLPQHYLLHATVDAVWIVSDGWRGAMHGLYALLRRLGCWYGAPGDAHTTIPTRGDLRFTDDVIEGPAMSGVDWQAQYGSTMPGFSDLAYRKRQLADWLRWRRRNRAPVGWIFSTNATVVRPELDQFPGQLLSQVATTYRAQMQGDPYNFAFVNGAYENPATSVNTNPTHHTAAQYDHDYASLGGYYTYYTQYLQGRIAYWKAHHADLTSDPDATYAVVAEVADGGHFCRCQKCLDILRYGPYPGAAPGNPDASNSDKAAHLANVAAKYIQALLPGAYAQVLAYNGGGTSIATHVAPPSIPVDPRVLYQVVFELFGDGWVMAARLPQWAAKRDAEGFVLGVYDYAALPADQGNNDPRVDVAAYGAKVQAWLAHGVDNVFSESTSSLGAALLPWRLTHDAVWDPGGFDPAASFDAFWAGEFSDPALRALARRSFDRYSSAGAGATDGARRYYETPYEWGELFNDLAAAAPLATDPVARGRLAAWQAYAVFQLLLYKARIAPATQAAQQAARGAMFYHACATYGTGAVQAAAILAMYNNGSVLSQAFIDQWNQAVPLVGGQSWEQRNGLGPPYPTPQQTYSAMTPTIAALAAAYPRIAVPAPPADAFDVVAVGTPPAGQALVADNYSQGTAEWPDGVATYVFVASGSGVVRLEGYNTTTAACWVVTLYDASGAALEAHTDDLFGATSAAPVVRQFDMSAHPAGVYYVTVDSRSQHRVLYPNSLPFARAGRCTRTMRTSATQPVFFWVPSDATVFHLCDSAGAPQLAVGGSARTASVLYNDDGSASDLYAVAVAPADAGKVWSLTGFGTGVLFLLDVPNLLSRSAAQVLANRGRL
jgi:hypothetical protein